LSRIASPAALPADIPPEGIRGTLSRQWDLVQFLLRDGLEAFNDDVAIAANLKTSKECLTFLDTMEGHAKKLNIRKGALSRMLLPFDLDEFWRPGELSTSSSVREPGAGGCDPGCGTEGAGGQGSRTEALDSCQGEGISPPDSLLLAGAHQAG
ncbi:unnamed protein product, partial [Polarella glacialis]